MPNEASEHKFEDSELIIGMVGAVGTEMDKVISVLNERLRSFRYTCTVIHLSEDVIPKIKTPASYDPHNEFARINALMDAGNMAREQTEDNSILALGAAAKIGAGRPASVGAELPFTPRQAYIIKSLKTPDEVLKMREIYSDGFFLIGVYSDENRRLKYLQNDKNIAAHDAEKLMNRDAYEQPKHGQRTSATFHLSDFFVHLDENQDKMKESIWRILDIMFGCPHLTPTFDEYAMFMAFSASLRSSDLSRQVGAVITKNNEIIATGANDCPRFGGGLYWPTFSESENKIVDADNGRDYKRGRDSNETEKENIIADICRQLVTSGVPLDEQTLKNTLRESKIKDITEYGRVVHAEMEALLSCARNSISSQDATLYCTTFPCHNCAKHIIASGVKRVVYVEPYSKSRAAEFHDDSICLGLKNDTNDLVHFEPFVGVGPRRFFDLFSMRLSSGYPIIRKNENGTTIQWEREKAKLRMQLYPSSYIELETTATSIFNTKRGGIGDGENIKEKVR